VRATCTAHRQVCSGKFPDDADALCGVTITFGIFHGGESAGNGSFSNKSKWDLVAMVLVAIFAVVIIAEIAVTAIRKRII
jgi:hypothetical protein